MALRVSASVCVHVHGFVRDCTRYQISASYAAITLSLSLSLSYHTGFVSFLFYLLLCQL